MSSSPRSIPARNGTAAADSYHVALSHDHLNIPPTSLATPPANDAIKDVNTATDKPAALVNAAGKWADYQTAITALARFAEDHGATLKYTGEMFDLVKKKEGDGVLPKGTLKVEYPETLDKLKMFANYLHQEANRRDGFPNLQASRPRTGDVEKVPFTITLTSKDVSYKPNWKPVTKNNIFWVL